MQSNSKPNTDVPFSLSPDEVFTLFSIMEKSSPVGRSCDVLTNPKFGYSRKERDLINKFNRSRAYFENQYLNKPS